MSAKEPKFQLKTRLVKTRLVKSRLDEPCLDDRIFAVFVGRARELDLLGQEYSSRKAAFVVLYGRRRVGKSELLLQFLRSRPGIYFVGKTAPSALQARELAREAARVVDEPLIAELPPDDWKRLLQTITDRWPEDRKLLLVFDEFQWLAEAVPELPSILQELWDTKWKRSGRVMLVLCGSYLGFMEREVLGRRSPLFGRRTAAIRLQPFAPDEAAEFHPRWSRVDQASAYFVCGGIPLYLGAFDPDLSVRQNIERTLLSEFAPLFREPDFLLREELRELDNYYAVLLAIANGDVTISDIAARTGINRGSVHYYTQTLVDLGYLGKRHPLANLDKKSPKRRLRFAVDDPLLRFWFRFIFPNQSSIVHFGPRRAFEVHIRPELDAFFGLCFEDFCRAQLPDLYVAEGVAARFVVGQWWNARAQIDVVGIRDDGRTDLGECKWGTVRSASALRRELEQKIVAFPNPRGATIFRRFFVRKKPARLVPAPGESWHDLDDLYA